MNTTEKISIEKINIRSLKGVPFEVVAEAFLNAFADYGMTLDEESLAAMLRRRGAKMELSFAAFDDEGRIVSFILNGIGNHGGRATAYDTGTGTIKEYRGQGLTDRIFSYSLTHLKQAGIENYLLEVLTHNTPAVKIYSRQGFETVRRLDCYTADNQQALDSLADKANRDIEIREMAVDEAQRCTSFIDFTPSWQNSFDSVRRNPEAFTCLIAYSGGIPVGMGISETAYGDITQVAVDPTHRRKGIGSRLLSELIGRNRIDRAKVLNVDHSCEAMGEFLCRSGFTLSCDQYEMCKPLV